MHVGITHNSDGSFRWSSNGSLMDGPDPSTFVVSRDRNDFVFVIGRDLYIFNGSGNRVYPSKRILNAPRRIIEKDKIHIIMHNRRFLIDKDSFNWIDCNTFELLLLSNGYYLIFDKYGYTVHTTGSNSDWVDRIPIWFLNCICVTDL